MTIFFYFPKKIRAVGERVGGAPVSPPLPPPPPPTPKPVAIPADTARLGCIPIFPLFCRQAGGEKKTTVPPPAPGDRVQDLSWAEEEEEERESSHFRKPSVI